MKVISFSLYGKIPKYCQGAIENAKLALKIFPDFTTWFYIDKSVPRNYIEQLAQMPNVRITNVLSSHIPKRMWRYLPADNPNVSLFISRDVDSRLSSRERFIVNDWINRKEIFINIKDNPLYHKFPVMLAGMWGMKSVTGFKMNEKIETWIQKKNIIDLDIYNLDQQFLIDVIYPLIKHDLAYYDDFNCNQEKFALNIPYKRKNYRYIGEIFDENNIPEQHWKAIREFDLNKKGFFGKKINSLLWKIGI